MKVTGKATIRNRFDIVCRDVVTGEETKYQAHNIVLDAMFTRLVNFQSFFVAIHFGTGTGTLSPARTSLFNLSGAKNATTTEQVRELPTSRWMRQIVLAPEEYVGHELTEVGVAYSTSSSSLVTHAFIEDSEGNPISIVKTDTMVVTIYATIFFELGELTSMYGGQWRWVMPLTSNSLVSYLMGATFPSTSFWVTAARHFMDGIGPSHGSSSNITPDSWIKDVANKKVTTPVRRLGINDGNGAIRGFGLSSVFRGLFPIPGVFTGHTIEGEGVGVGDGSQAEFNLAWNGATEDSVTVKVDGVEASPTIAETISELGLKINNPVDLPAGTGRGAAFSRDGTLLAVAHDSSPYLTVYSVDGATLTKLSDPVDLPASNGQGAAFSPDGTLLAVAHDASPYLTVYSVSGGTLTKLPDPADLPAGIGYGAAFSPDGTLLAVAHDASPYLTVYSVDGATLTKLPNPADRPTGDGRGAAFSPDGTLLAVAHWNSPYLTVYSVDGATLTKLPDPADLPTGTGYGAAFSPDGTLLTVAHNASPYLTVYSVSGGTLTKLPDPADLPTGIGRGTEFSHDGTLLAVAHSSSPYLTVYQVDGATLTKLPNPADRPADTGYGAAFSSDGTLLAVAHNASPCLTVYDGAYNTGAVHHITFATAPAAGAVITADYTVPYIPKDENHVLDLQCAIQWGEP